VEQSRPGCGDARRSGAGKRKGRKKGEGGADRRALGVSSCEKKGKREKETWAAAGRD
jgi:hypothetical protein